MESLTGLRPLRGFVGEALVGLCPGTGDDGLIRTRGGLHGDVEAPSTRPSGARAHRRRRAEGPQSCGESHRRPGFRPPGPSTWGSSIRVSISFAKPPPSIPGTLRVRMPPRAIDERHTSAMAAASEVGSPLAPAPASVFASCDCASTQRVVASAWASVSSRQRRLISSQDVVVMPVPSQRDHLTNCVAVVQPVESLVELIDAQHAAH